MSTAAIVSLLSEIESAVADIETWLPEGNDQAAWATTRCNEIRDALMAADAASAAIAACQLGERLVEIRRLGETARRLAEHADAVEQRARDKIDQRKAVYFAERNRTFSDSEAYKRAAIKLGVTVKTIQRAVNES
jgi:hypothetical protein